MKRLLNRLRSPVLVLFLLSPAIGELLSGSSPPAEFFTPFGLLIMPSLYGSGAILVRELTRRWNKGWATLLTLGAAYGIVEEGWLCKSFYDPQWPDLGVLAHYGRWGGVNWVWSVNLTIYHASVSIAIPILLVELMFPERREERWLNTAGLVFFALLEALVVVLGFLFIGAHGGTPYRAPVLPYLGGMAAAISLVLLARRLPLSLGGDANAPVPRARWFAVLGLLSLLLFFALPAIASQGGLHPAFAVLLVGALVWGVALVVGRMSGWGERGKSAIGWPWLREC